MNFKIIFINSVSQCFIISYVFSLKALPKAGTVPYRWLWLSFDNTV